MKLPEYLEWKKLTLKQFASQAGLSESFLCRVKNRERRPSPEVAIAIERASEGRITRMELLYPD